MVVEQTIRPTKGMKPEKQVNLSYATIGNNVRLRDTKGDSLSGVYEVFNSES